MRFPKSWAARIGAVAAAVTIVGSGAAVAANAATSSPAAPAPAVHHYRIATSLSIKEATSAHHPHFALIAGRLRTTRGDIPIRHRWVILQRQGAAGHWFGVRAERTGLHGGVLFLVHARSPHNFRLLFRGTFHLRRSVSGVVTVQ
jgi:hypothetical protein